MLRLFVLTVVLLCFTSVLVFQKVKGCLNCSNCLVLLAVLLCFCCVCGLNRFGFGSVLGFGLDEWLRHTPGHTGHPDESAAAAACSPGGL